MNDRVRDSRGFFTIENVIVRAYGKALGPFGLAVYCALCSHADSSGECFPGLEKLAEMISISERKIRSEVARLAELGLITIEPQRAASGRQGANLYTILPARNGGGEGAHGAGGRVHTVHPNNTHREQDPFLRN